MRYVWKSYGVIVIVFMSGAFVIVRDWITGITGHVLGISFRLEVGLSVVRLVIFVLLNLSFSP